MRRQRSSTVPLWSLAVLALLSGYHRPNSDPDKLRAIKAEAEMLMADQAIEYLPHGPCGASPC